MRGYRAILAVVAALLCLSAEAQAAAVTGALPTIGPAPEFKLTTQDGNRLSLQDLRGKVVVLTFIFASCQDTCPMLTHKMVTLQPRLGTDFGANAFFVSISVDPERDSPAVLKRYAAAHGAELGGWAFLTGPRREVRDIVRRYGAFYRQAPGGNIDHTALTSLVDRDGMLRVQYMGVRFDADEMLGDIRSLIQEKQENAPR